MTNGEMIKSIFPSAEIDIGNGGNDIWIAIDCWTIFKKEWWNAEYKEPTTKNDLGVDCISRTRAIERLKLNFPISQGADNSRDRHRYMQALADLQAIKELPPARAKKGHWMNKQRLFDSCSAECSSCHKRSNGYMHDNGFSLASAYYDFCPKCGARMVEPQESEG